MKLIALLFINCVAIVASDQYALSGTVEKVTKQPNQWMIVKTSGDKTIEQVVIQKEITAEDDLMVKYSIKDRSDAIIAEGNGPLCDDSESMARMMADLLGLYLDVDLQCPISKQKGTKPSSYQSGPIELAEDPGQGAKLWSEISLTKNDQAIVTINTYGRAM
ncbi:uncharacterized protein LOC135160616 [Diachasmimorpha longicaudata]|uniref:uncharacterized protein LOC135160616 n=1 Tax=Diachasmimorpha longicaudata TaxID=58733 RepID=UPI0030B86D28